VTAPRRRRRAGDGGRVPEHYFRVEHGEFVAEDNFVVVFVEAFAAEGDEELAVGEEGAAVPRTAGGVAVGWLGPFACGEVVDEGGGEGFGVGGFPAV